MIRWSEKASFQFKLLSVKKLVNEMIRHIIPSMPTSTCEAAVDAQLHQYVADAVLGHDASPEFVFDLRASIEYTSVFDEFRGGVDAYINEHMNLAMSSAKATARRCCSSDP
jgi:hypothetical protein